MGAKSTTEANIMLLLVEEKHVQHTATQSLRWERAQALLPIYRMEPPIQNQARTAMMIYLKMRASTFLRRWHRRQPHQLPIQLPKIPLLSRRAKSDRRRKATSEQNGPYLNI